MAKAKHPESKIYQLKVTLLNSDPPIWRRLAVPGSFSFEELHAVIQASLEWENAHLHQFVFGNKGSAFFISHPEFELEEVQVKDYKAVEKTLADLGSDGEMVTLEELKESNVLDETLLDLQDVVTHEGVTFTYEYDFGDSWDHEILVEKIAAPEAGIEYPICLDGARSGPPEDCGGIDGYADLLDALRDPKRDDHTEALEWVGEDFDPEEFDVDDINAEVPYFEDYLIPPDSEADFTFDDDEDLSEEKLEEAIAMINEQAKAFIQEVIPSPDGFALRFPGGIPLVNVVVPQFAAMTYAQQPQLKVSFEIGPGSEPVWIRFTGSQSDLQAAKELLGID